MVPSSRATRERIDIGASKRNVSRKTFVDYVSRHMGCVSIYTSDLLPRYTETFAYVVPLLGRFQQLDQLLVGPCGTLQDDARVHAIKCYFPNQNSFGRR